MSQNQFIEMLEDTHMKKDIPHFQVGDTVRVHLRIIEGNKERTQVFEGTVIAKKGKGLSESFTVYRNAYGSNMERVFLLHSPRIQKIQVMRSGRVRRAKLYYLRGATGKRAKVRELLGAKSPAAIRAAAKLKKAAEVELEELKPGVDETINEAVKEEVKETKAEKPKEN